MEAMQESYREDATGPYTIEDIKALPDGKRAELINGYIFMMATPTTTHQRISGEIYAEIRNHIRTNKGKCQAFTAPCAVYLDARETGKNWVEPDIFVVCTKDKIHEDGIYGAPEWVIEIASPSSIARDFMKKINLYGQYGVTEYWIVNPMKEVVTVFIFLPQLQTYQYSFYDEISPSLYPDLSINIRGLLS